MSKESDDVNKILSFYRVNNPKTTKDRLHITKALGNTSAVFNPSIVAQIMNTAIALEEISTDQPLTGTIEILFNNKAVKSVITEISLPLLAVAYDVANVGEIFESGIANNAVIELEAVDTKQTVKYHFVRKADMYIPQPTENFSLYTTCLFPYYHKTLSTLEDWA